MSEPYPREERLDGGEVIEEKVGNGVRTKEIKYPDGTRKVKHEIRGLWDDEWEV